MMDHFDCDVLVVGGGSAGLRAAIECREKRLDVCVLSKATAGKATATIVSGGVFAGTGEGQSTQGHLKRTLQAGRGINQPDLVQILVEEAPVRLSEMMTWGIKADLINGYLFSHGKAPMWGRAITECLLARCQAQGVRFADGMFVADVTMVDGAAVVAAFHIESRQWITITAGALVLAAGGASALFQRHDNPLRMMGDGYVLALKAGAVLQHMEFVQFYPLGVAEPGLSALLIPPRLADLGGLHNDKGQEIHEKYNITERPAGERARDRLSQALFKEIYRDGRDVWLDLTKVTDAQWHADPFSGSTRKILGERYGATEKPLRIAPMAHHVMGGVQIEPTGFTGVAGFFAAGEVTGGVHGANRMGGNALTETLVFGKRAGEAAARWAVESGRGRNESAGRLVEHYLERSSRSATDLDARKLTGQLQQVMWTDGGILRNQKGLAKTLNTVKDIQQQADESSLGGSPDQIQRILELRSAAATAELILEAAQRREESRGAHFREDFPDQDDENWKGALQVHLNSQGERIWKFRAI